MKSFILGLMVVGFMSVGHAEEAAKPAADQKAAATAEKKGEEKPAMCEHCGKPVDQCDCDKECKEHGHKDCKDSHHKKEKKAKAKKK